jgi:HEAT repeat protein
MRSMNALVLCAVLAVLPTVCLAQDSDLETQWNDFIHYIKIAQPDMVQSFGKAILDSRSRDSEVYTLASQTDGIEQLLDSAANMNTDLESLISDLRVRIDDGYLELRSDPDSILRSIDALTGQGARAHANATQRLIESGEYAVPLMVQRLSDDETSEDLKSAIIEVFPQIGKDAVRPLSVALQTEETWLQEVFADALGEIGYPMAVPRLRELRDTKDLLPRTQMIVENAIIKCAGESALDKPLTELFFELGVQYYDMEDSLLPDGRYPLANVWHWDTASQLQFRKVPHEIFCDVYAMRNARLALSYDGDNYPAVTLWLAADIRKEADLPAGETDPLRGETQPAAAFYIAASGAQYAQEVLQIALEDYDSRVAVAAIDALAMVAGDKNLLLTTSEGAQPLVEALTYPDRHVRFRAGCALANALPAKNFNGDDLVVSVLNEAIRQSAQKTALLIVEDSDLNNRMKDALRAKGFDVIDNPDPKQAIVEAYQAGGADMIVVADAPDAVDVRRMTRKEASLVATPLVVATLTTDPLRSMAKRDGRTILVDGELTEETLDGAMREINELLVGEPMMTDEQNEWTIRAAESVRALGLSNTEVFNLSRTRPMLAKALQIEVPEVQTAAAEALAVLSDAQAQKDIHSLTVDEFISDSVRISALDALAESARRFGNHLSGVESQKILAMVQNDSASQDVREAAAQVLGALDLPSDEIKPLILSTEGHD